MKTITLVITMLTFCVGLAFANDIAIGYSSKTGDIELDLGLQNLNIEAQADLEDFSTQLVLSYGVEKPVVRHLVTDLNMPPADAYMTIKTARISGEPIEKVVEVYQKNRQKGWGQIAKGMGIAPGSEKFKRLKDDDSGMLSKAKGKKKKGQGQGKGKGKGKHKDSDD